MSEALKLALACPEPTAHAAIAAALAQDATVGPVVQKIIELIRAGIRNLPDILAALAAMGVVLPPWVTIIIHLLLALIPPTPTPPPIVGPVGA